MPRHRPPHRSPRRTLALASAGLLVGSVLLAAPAATGAPGVAGTEAPGATTGSAQPRADQPGDDARIAAAVAALPGIVNDAMAVTGAPGAAVSVVHDGELIYSEGFGVRDVDTDAPVSPGTVFQLASFSKSIGASVVAAAIGRKVAAWDTPVRELMPWFALKDPYVTRNVTVGDLYTMRSGLPPGAADALETVGYDRLQILRRLRYLDLSPFRVQHQYTNFGLTAAAEAVSVAAGTPWATLSERLLYRPLGMTSTSSLYSQFLTRPDRAALHVKVDGTMVSRYTRDPDAQSPAGGVSSNVLDLAKWMIMMLGDGVYQGQRVVAEAPLTQAQAAHSRSTPVTTPAAVPRFYGYGIGTSVGRAFDVRLTHSGAFTQGAGTAYLMIPEYDLGITVLSNACVGLPEIVTTSFGDLVETGAVQGDYLSEFPAIFAGFYAPDPALAPDARPTDPKPARAPSLLAGTYRNAFWGDVRVVRDGSRLRLLLGPDRAVVPLEPWNGDTFVGTFGYGRDYPFRTTVTFGGGGSGRARTLTLALGPGQVGLLRRAP